MQLPTTLLPTRNSKRKQYSSDRRRIDPNAIFFLIWKEKGGTFVKRASDSAKKKRRGKCWSRRLFHRRRVRRREKNILLRPLDCGRRRTTGNGKRRRHHRSPADIERLTTEDISGTQEASKQNRAGPHRIFTTSIIS